MELLHILNNLIIDGFSVFNVDMNGIFNRMQVSGLRNCSGLYNIMMLLDFMILMCFSLLDEKLPIGFYSGYVRILLLYECGSLV
ncbi:hypothetical protein MKY37_06370 [Psychrobacillus sp. FSL K6-2836]|uniref:hypothetical protein n=1 Tax=Psychrobacillus sp. FSL K6-2836 TaxID=2921548 RepID=UPI0030FC33E9